MRRISHVMMWAALGVLLASDTALAIRGVKSLTFNPEGSICLEGQAYPCDPDAGLGESNIVYVHQREVDGQYVFDSLEVPGIPDGKMWVGVRYAAECKFGYHVEGAWVRTGWSNDEGKGGDPIQIYEHMADWPVDHAGQKTVWSQLLDLQVSIDLAFDAGLFTHFETAEEIFVHGESVISDRMASGMTEEEARATPFHFQDWISMHGGVRCKGNVFGREGWKTKSAPIPVKFVFVGLGSDAKLEPAPLIPEAPTDELTFGVAVTDAFLFVEPDANEQCRLRLTGAFTTNAPTDILYRFVDELGHASQMFQTSVDQTFVAMIDHYVDLPVVAVPDGEVDQLVTELEIDYEGELVSAPTDREQGFYQIQVLEPHGYWSNVADFNVEPCRPEWTIVDGLLPQEWQIAEGVFPAEWQIAEGALPAQELRPTGALAR